MDFIGDCLLIRVSVEDDRFEIATSISLQYTIFLFQIILHKPKVFLNIWWPLIWCSYVLIMIWFYIWCRVLNQVIFLLSMVLTYEKKFLMSFYIACLISMNACLRDNVRLLRNRFITLIPLPLVMVVLTNVLLVKVKASLLVISNLNGSWSNAFKVSLPLVQLVVIRTLVNLQLLTVLLVDIILLNEGRKELCAKSIISQVIVPSTAFFYMTLYWKNINVLFEVLQ